MTAPRVPAGVPSGGQFAASARNESEVGLVDRDFCPHAPLTPRDVERLIEYKGTFEWGYDSDDINRVFGGFESARLTCVWDYFDATGHGYGYGGGSEIAGQALGSRASGAHGAGRAVPEVCGSWRHIHPDAWEYLSDNDTDLDPEQIPSLLSDEVFYETIPALDDMSGDGMYNLAIEAETEQCSVDECDAPRDNEGYGRCGTHADLTSAHDDGDHEADSDGPNPDCPECT